MKGYQKYKNNQIWLNGWPYMVGELTHKKYSFGMEKGRSNQKKN